MLKEQIKQFFEPFKTLQAAITVYALLLQYSYIRWMYETHEMLGTPTEIIGIAFYVFGILGNFCCLLLATKDKELEVYHKYIFSLLQISTGGLVIVTFPNSQVLFRKLNLDGLIHTIDTASTHKELAPICLAIFTVVIQFSLLQFTKVRMIDQLNNMDSSKIPIGEHFTISLEPLAENIKPIYTSSEEEESDYEDEEQEKTSKSKVPPNPLVVVSPSPRKTNHKDEDLVTSKPTSNAQSSTKAEIAKSDESQSVRRKEVSQIPVRSLGNVQKPEDVMRERISVASGAIPKETQKESPQETLTFARCENKVDETRKQAKPDFGKRAEIVKQRSFSEEVNVSSEREGGKTKDGEVRASFKEAKNAIIEKLAEADASAKGSSVGIKDGSSKSLGTEKSLTTQDSEKAKTLNETVGIDKTTNSKTEKYGELKETRGTEKELEESNRAEDPQDLEETLKESESAEILEGAGKEKPNIEDSKKAEETESNKVEKATEESKETETKETNLVEKRKETNGIGEIIEGSSRVETLEESNEQRKDVEESKKTESSKAVKESSKELDGVKAVEEPKKTENSKAIQEPSKELNGGKAVEESRKTESSKAIEESSKSNGTEKDLEEFNKTESSKAVEESSKEQNGNFGSSEVSIKISNGVKGREESKESGTETPKEMKKPSEHESAEMTEALEKTLEPEKVIFMSEEPKETGNVPNKSKETKIESQESKEPEIKKTAEMSRAEDRESAVSDDDTDMTDSDAIVNSSADNLTSPDELASKSKKVKKPSENVTDPKKQYKGKRSKKKKERKD